MGDSVILEGYIDRPKLAKEIGRSQRTIVRLENEPDGLPFTQFGKRKIYRIEAVRDWLLRRERRPNRRREA